MTEFALRGTFYLGDNTSSDQLEALADQVMDNLVLAEKFDPTVRDAAVSLDLGSRTIEIELIVTADAMLEAHELATRSVNAAFQAGYPKDAEERSVELLPA